ncbi:hypothetical protein [Microbacterium sp. G2-8]|uniref:hypothetical protein n=1 Tax=Microbacterium sp. G2-8 TaxID=2842454 RepID=UPI001C899E0A|nr:hypothetical protein [Microbacterium sp. G2-8]
MSLATRVTDLATRIGQEFKNRFGPLLSETSGGAVTQMLPNTAYRARKVGGLVTLQGVHSGTIPTGMSIVGTLAPEYVPPFVSHGGAVISGNPAGGYMQVTPEGEIRVFNTSGSSATSMRFYFTYPVA